MWAPSAVNWRLKALICILTLARISSLTIIRAKPNQLAATRYELKFQNELDNSTIIKNESQQQIFKCQVRLAPQASFNSKPSQRSTFNLTQLSAGSVVASTDELLNGRPVNVTLTIDWFRDSRPLSAVTEPEVIVINVELNKKSSRLDKSSKNNKSRIEIKNTLNSHQLKLTSRLKLTHLRRSDSGQYKCIARANYITTLPVDRINNSSSLSGSSESIESSFSPEQQQQQQSLPLLMAHQDLESNGASLMVTNATLSSSSYSPGDNKKKGAKLVHDKTMKQASARNLATSGSGNDGLHAKLATSSRHATTTTLDESPQAASGDYSDRASANTASANRDAAAAAQSIENNQQSSIVLGAGPHENDSTHEGQIGGLLPPIVGLSSAAAGQFEDDEDLFRMEQQQQQHQQASEFISGQPTLTNDDNEDTSLRKLILEEMLLAEDGGSREQTNDLLEKQRQINVQNGADLLDMNTELPNQWPQILSLENAIADTFQRETTNNESSSTLLTPSIISSSSSSSMATKHQQLNDKLTGTNYQQRNRDNRTGHRIESSPPSPSTDAYFNNPLDSYKFRHKLAKFVHKIAPELGCYTGYGEHYHGNASESVDNRPCVNWLHVQRALSKAVGQQQSNRLAIEDSTSNIENHNYCRNPSSDLRGPWCYVEYSAPLDGPTLKVRPFPNNQANNAVTYIQRTCNLAPCSEYLWLYIVAPPTGLLLLMVCVATVLIRSVKRSQYKSIFGKATGKRRTLPKLNKLLLSKGSRYAARKLNPSTKKVAGNYLDEDIFEIVDDIDWSDGNTQHSLSPKSNESLKLNSSYSSSSNNTDKDIADIDSQRFGSAIGSRSTNPIFCDRQAIHPEPIHTQSSQLNSLDLMRGPLPLSRPSANQLGPMFATLRCHVRGSSLRSKNQQVEQQSVNKSTSTFIEQADGLCNPNTKLSSENSNSLFTDQTAINNQNNQKANLISCSSTMSGLNGATSDSTRPTDMTGNNSQQTIKGSGQKSVNGNELAQLNASSVVIAMDQQPIYEGKFSLVQVAYIKPRQQDDQDPRASVGHLGSQAAVCSLKQIASIDPKLFFPENLKLRNLNHLNIVKLIGYAHLSSEQTGSLEMGAGNDNNANSTNICSLIYDMSHLVDLNDWLKQQSKDTLVSNEPGTDQSVRRHLTCFAKQIALAIDYLHDQDIIYKDLACRNCFLDVTKMLVKLASFNIELVADTNDGQQAMSLKSMIRPKFLLDYYVIDTRPTECQLLPLSWIPLESILFNKFNKQTDIWSFGCLIYELFSLGEVAYFGYSSKQVIDAVRSNLMPPQPLLCPNGIYKLMCKCLSDIPTLRPNVKQVYEQLNLYSGQCSSFLDHHLCSLATSNFYDDQLINNCSRSTSNNNNDNSPASKNCAITSGKTNSITKTKSYANIRNYSPANSNSNNSNNCIDSSFGYDNCNLLSVKQTNNRLASGSSRPEAQVKIPLSRSINLGANRQTSFGNATIENRQVRLKDCDAKNDNNLDDKNQYDEPILEPRIR